MTENQQGEVDPRVQAAAKAYIYGYPLVYNMEHVRKFVIGGGSLPVAAPFNQFGYARKLLGPETMFVTPNNDTLYIMAMCDVRPGPLLLHVPDTQDRYYVLQFVDTWTNNFAYVGRRATGTAEAEYLLAPAGYDDEVPGGVRNVIEAPSGVFTIVGRVQVDGEADEPAVHALQDRFTLTPLSGTQAPIPGVPEPHAGVGEDLLFWEQLRVYMAAFPPPQADREVLSGMEQLGFLGTESPYVNPGPELAALLTAGEQAGKDELELLIKAGGGKPVNGWSSATHLFDYNLDYLGLGTIDSPEWKIADRMRAYVARAIGARAGLWGNHGYEAYYAMIYTDAGGEQLSGAHRYELRLESMPPVDAFWSLTMYDTPDFHLVANPINRYSIGDRTPGLKLADDGSLTIYFQKDSPGPEKEPNWLPAPEGDFRPVMRMYQPRDAVLNSTYVLPPITRVD
jgi:hypothetical protein